VNGKLKGTVLAVALAVTLAACGGGDDGGASGGGGGEALAQGVTADEILIGMAAPVTGPVAYGGIGGLAGMEAYFNSVNAKGGVNGRKLKMVLEDTAYDPGQTLAAVRKLWTSDKVFAIPAVFGSAPYLATQSYLGQQKIPSFGWGPSSDVYCQTNDTSFGLLTRYEIQSGVAVEFLAKDLKAKQENAKISLVIPDDSYGDSIQRGAEAAAKQNGMTLASVDRVARTATEFGAVINNLKTVGSDYVVLVPTRAAAAGIMKASQAQGLDVTFISPSDATTETAVLGLAGPFYADRYYGVTSFATWDDPDDPLIKLMRDEFTKAGKQDLIKEKNLFSIFGMLHAATVVKALEKAGDNPTQESFVEALNSFKDVDLGGLVAPVTYKGSDFKLPGKTAKVSKAELRGSEYVLNPVTELRDLDYEAPFPAECPNNK
jgi:branched-chain amino acid transport system substrate-binding protein